jgi:hypothetical protein
MDLNLRVLVSTSCLRPCNTPTLYILKSLSSLVVKSPIQVESLISLVGLKPTPHPRDILTPLLQRTPLRHFPFCFVTTTPHTFSLSRHLGTLFLRPRRRLHAPAAPDRRSEISEILYGEYFTRNIIRGIYYDEYAKLYDEYILEIVCSIMCNRSHLAQRECTLSVTIPVSHHV